MDEILIEEKKYVSSKRAAKMTGYAKDYVGQLCREGRVPARLVGRSWYVLESAIQDHRFGTTESEEKEVSKTKSTEESEVSSWESPRYEVVNADELPSLNSSESREDGERNVSSQAIHDSWREWFDHVATTSVEATPKTEETFSEVSIAEEVLEEQEEEPEEDLSTEEQDVVSVPLHVVNQPLPREFMPRGVYTTYATPDRAPTTDTSTYGGNRRSGGRTIQLVGVLVAVVSVVLAAIGSGYFDKYILSLGDMEMITGAVLYNK